MQDVASMTASGRPSGAAGRVLGALIGVVGRARPGRRPFHPAGQVLPGRLVRAGASPGSTGVPWLDARSADDVVVRLSRGAGLPRWCPDVHGLALTCPDGPVDLLLSTSASSLPVLRHLPGLRKRHGTGPYSSLLPFAGPDGPVMLRAVPDPAWALPADPDRAAAALGRRPLRLTLEQASLLSRWRPVATLEIMATAHQATDPPVRFDPLRTPPGLRTYPWVRRLRTPAYATARRRPLRPGHIHPHPEERP
jgi:hypothetical protein